MASTKGRIARMVSGLLLDRAVVLDSQSIGEYQRLLLQCELPSLRAGMKVQFLLPSDDMRTYTPIPAPGGMLLLACRGVAGPGANWMSNAKAGDELRFLGPQRSLAFEDGRALVIGDETSVAVAAALSTERPGMVHAIIQAASGANTLQAAASVGLSSIEVVQRDDAAATADAAMAYLRRFQDARTALTGCSELVVGVRDSLRERGVRDVKTKTHWIPGRSGID